MVSATPGRGGNIDSAFNQPIIPFPSYNTGGLASSLPFTCSTMYISGGSRGVGGGLVGWGGVGAYALPFEMKIISNLLSTV